MFLDCFHRYSSSLYEANGIAGTGGIPDVHGVMEQPAVEDQRRSTLTKESDHRSIVD